jgi:hypothetical protein
MSGDDYDNAPNAYLAYKVLTSQPVRIGKSLGEKCLAYPLIVHHKIIQSHFLSSAFVYL